MANLEGRIPHKRSVIVAADVYSALLGNLVEATHEVKGIGGYKVGMQLVLNHGLFNTVAMVKDSTDLPVIFDYQKAGNDIPAMGEPFAQICKDAKVDAAILFPFGGEQTQKDWIKALQDRGVGVLVGAHMTQPGFLWSEGGYIHDSAPGRIFENAAKEGIKDFVVPGNKAEFVKQYKELFDRVVGPGEYTLYAPGFITQGGEISEMAQAAGDNWHAIVGSAIYNAVDIKKAAEETTAQITK